jgi:hypothetical protein
MDAMAAAGVSAHSRMENGIAGRWHDARWRGRTTTGPCGGYDGRSFDQVPQPGPGAPGFDRCLGGVLRPLPGMGGDRAATPGGAISARRAGTGKTGRNETQEDEGKSRSGNEGDPVVEKIEEVAIRVREDPGQRHRPKRRREWLRSNRA